MGEKNFGYLGASFQLSLLKTIIEDKKFATNIVDVIDSKYFDGPYFRYIMELVKEIYSKYGQIPSYETIKQHIMSENKDTSTKIHLDTLKQIYEHKVDIPQNVKDTSLNFCKQQHLKKSLKDVENIMNSGNFEDYHKIESLILKSLQVGSTSDGVTDVFDDVLSTLENQTRHPMSTGIKGIDNLLKGGLGIGELGMVLAPTGTGKTTLLTLFANTAFNEGKNVLQIFFEDSEINIKRKHYTIWSGFSPDQQINNIQQVVNTVKEKHKNDKNFLKLLKLPSFGVTVSYIKSIVRKIESEGNKIDLLIIDYIDCLSGENGENGEEWKGEGNIMRHLESMASEFNIAIWTATQGSRQSISSEIVTADQMGGSIKKAQIAHVVLSVAKTLTQKENNLATLSLLKSRIGKDGIVFNNCLFNNELLIIDTDAQEDGMTMFGIEKEKEKERANRAAELYKKRQERERQANEQI